MNNAPVIDKVLERIYQLYNGRRNLYDIIRPMAEDRYDRLVAECNNNLHYVYNTTGNSPGYLWSYTYGIYTNLGAELTSVPLKCFYSTQRNSLPPPPTDASDRLRLEISAVSRFFVLYEPFYSHQYFEGFTNAPINSILPKHKEYVDYFVQYMENVGFVRIPCDMLFYRVPDLVIDDTENPDIFKCLFSFTEVW